MQTRQLVSFTTLMTTTCRHQRMRFATGVSCQRSLSSASSVPRGEEVRVRFAPSPTGKLHIGGLRTALYNYLFARKHGGVFMLRIEDTDQTRLQPGSVESILEGLAWAGITPDLGPHKPCAPDSDSWYQSQRLHLYERFVNELLANGKAYRCFCDETRLNLQRKNALHRKEAYRYDRRCRHLSEAQVTSLLAEGRAHVVRFRVDEDRDVSYVDLTNGAHKSNPYQQEGDFIVLKSDKYPTYHLANVIDDHLMRVTHVLRGQEWQLSTAKHLLLYEAFGWQAPRYAHLPLMCNADGSKISKRQNDADVMSYRARGYVPEAVLAYLATVGGGGITVNLLERLGGDACRSPQDIVDTLVEHFDETKMSSRSAKLSPDLLDNVNGRCLRIRMGSDEGARSLVHQLRRLVKSATRKCVSESTYVSDEYLASVLAWAVRDRVSKLMDLVESVEYSFLWTDMSNAALSDGGVNGKETGLLDDLCKCDRLLELIAQMQACVSAYGDDSVLFKARLGLILDELTSKHTTNPEEEEEQTDQDKQDKKKRKRKQSGSNNYWHLTRTILTGLAQGPPVAEIVALLGAHNTLHRLDVAKQIVITARDKLLSTPTTPTTPTTHESS